MSIDDVIKICDSRGITLDEYILEKEQLKRQTASWYDSDISDIENYTAFEHQLWKANMLAEEAKSMTKTKPQVITTDCSGLIIDDLERRLAFKEFDKAARVIGSSTDYRIQVGGCTHHFRKNPIDGSWYIYKDGIKYIRTRVSDCAHFDDALTIAVSKVDAIYNKRDVIDLHVGDLALQFVKVERFNEVSRYVLVNCAHIPLPVVQLTQAEYDDIIDKQLTQKLNIFWEDKGIAFYAPPQQPVQILNPVVITTNKDYNMPKYRLRKADELLIQVLEGGATNVALLLGKPGTGKTFFTDCYAVRTGAEYMYSLCHDGTNAEDLFYSVNVGKAVLREGKTSDDIYQAGLLLRVVRASQHHKVVLCIDEIDKASKRTENLFLDFAETYRVPFLDTQEVGVKENITIFFTSNGYRPHSEAFLRRCYRHHFDFLPREVEISLIGGTYAEKIVDALAAIRKDGASSPSIKEGMLFAHNLQFAKTKSDIELLFYAHLCKEEEDFEVLKKGNFADKFVKPAYQKVTF